MSPDDEDHILDDLFQGCAFAAFIDQAAEEGWPPDCEATRRRAFAYYEQALARKNGHARESMPSTETHLLAEAGT